MSQDDTGRQQLLYAQTWEDADILLEALEVKEGQTCVSICSGGDNVLSLVSQGPKKVIAIDRNPFQLAALKLRIAAYQKLQHTELPELIGSKKSANRVKLYEVCRPLLDVSSKGLWDAHFKKQLDIEKDFTVPGIGEIGRFEKYFELFRNRVLPLACNQRVLKDIFVKKNFEERKAFYEQHLNNWRWRVFLKIFFSQFVMKRIGRNPSFFRYVEKSVSRHILKSIEHGLTVLDPVENPYLQWIIEGEHRLALPHALREENFEDICKNLHCLELHCSSVEGFLSQRMGESFVNAFNLSDIFEYMSEEKMKNILEMICEVSVSGARLAYWNMIVERSCKNVFVEKIKPLNSFSQELHFKDKGFFYANFFVDVVEK